MSITMIVPVRPMPALWGPTKRPVASSGDEAVALPMVAPAPRGPAPPPSHLQCTTIGPAPGVLLCARFTSSRKPRTPAGSAGTPWSGQLKYW